MKTDKWEWLAVMVLIVCVAAYFISKNMIEADRFSDCLQRGGEMRKIDDVMQCKVAK